MREASRAGPRRFGYDALPPALQEAMLSPDSMMPPPEGEEERQYRRNLIVLAIVIAAVIGCVWLLIEYKKSSDALDCLAAHHTNCSPDDTQSVSQ